ncbi:MAG: UDP-N-acetylmuramoyl-tripeptide--D-alanyl-D-alanine ligase, partial [Candidatus Pacebacteria bacterium]|nr:UDP-N-acetylmuramoyl-tripeptide--D-alanyl-D-alanine ligase [Candidatus Paceibacterota bacterium]
MKLIVKKTLAHTMRWESKLVLSKYKPKVIAITGSVGKTSTKDAVYATIAKISHVRKSEKSFNSELGLPLTILGCPNGWNNIWAWTKNLLKGLWLFLYPHKYPKWLVLEVGIGKPGDMDRTASWLKTDAVIMTTIGTTPAHIEFFSSTKHIVEEKSKLIKTLKKDGLLILNADDEAVLEMKHKTKCVTITYGFGEGADVVGSAESIFYNESGEPAGIIFRVDAGGVSLPVTIEGVFGRNHAYAALASLALSFGLKFNLLNAVESLKNYEFPPGRMCLLKGINDTLIIDDTYNSSPFACESALRTLGEVGERDSSPLRKIAVLGDMLELGKHTEEAHKNIGKFASSHVEVLMVVGPRAKSIKEGALEAGMKAENIFEF